MTIGTPKLTETQTKILDLLTLRGHAMFSTEVAAEIGARYISARSLYSLRAHDYIRPTDQGWLSTDSGKIRGREGV